MLLEGRRIIESYSNFNKEQVLRQILKYIKRIKTQQLLLSFFAYNQFKELEAEASWDNILVEEVTSECTSQICVRCGFTSKTNRLTQRMFKCDKCSW